MAGARKWGSRRRDPDETPGSDLSGITELDLIDVTLVTEVSGARAEVPRLGLAFKQDGMTVRTPDGAPYVRIPWVSLRQLSAEASSERNSSSTAVTLEVRSNRKNHRFVVPNVQPQALTGSLGVVSSLYGRADLFADSKPASRRH
jgi:hypothetical protein